MAVVALDREAARAAISAAAGRFTALLRDTDDIERPAAGTNWTVAETAAHVSCVFTGFSAAIAGEPQALRHQLDAAATAIAALHHDNTLLRQELDQRRRLVTVKGDR